MKKKKFFFDAVFILICAVALFVLNQYGLLEKHAQFALIPMLVAYFLGQFIERKTGSKAE